jgi:hypothetical protein
MAARIDSRPPRFCATPSRSAPAGSGILYDAFHFMVLLTRSPSIAVRECVLTKNASAHGEARVAFIICMSNKAGRPWQNLEKCL